MTDASATAAAVAPGGDLSANQPPLSRSVASGQASASLSIQALSRHYGAVRALDDLNLHVEGSTFLTLLGPSGCGKSTTLSLVAGLDKPDSGRILLAGTDITDLPPNERGMAMVFQSYALYPHMSVFENIAFSLKLKRRSKEEVKRRVESVARMLDVMHLLDRRPSELSGGQQQRVGLGRALIKQPRVFLLDEPFSNLDAALRTRMRTEIKHLHLRLGTTTVFVTHDQEEAMSLSDRIAVMKDGRVVQFGTQDDIYRRPCNVYVATFVGRPRMSLLRGTLIRDGHGGRFAAPGVELELGPQPGEGGGEASFPAVLGIRAEHVVVHPDGAPERVRTGSATAEATIVLLEPMGSDTFVELAIGGQTVVARVPPSLPLSIGQRVTVEFVAEGVHLFDAKTEERVRP